MLAKRTVRSLWGVGSVSEWEAQALRTHDGVLARNAAVHGREVRARLQEEMAAGKKQRRRAVRKLEQARQLDRQREQMHPPHVLDTLQAMEPPAPASLSLPRATPDLPGEHPIRVLEIRPRREEPNTWRELPCPFLMGLSKPPSNSVFKGSCGKPGSVAVGM